MDAEVLGLINLLSTRTAITPDVPSSRKTLLSTDAANLGAGYAFVVAIVPFTDVLGDLDTGTTGNRVGREVSVGVPWECGGLVKAEKLKGALGTFAWGNVAKQRDVSVTGCIGCGNDQQVSGRASIITDDMSGIANKSVRAAAGQLH